MTFRWGTFGAVFTIVSVLALATWATLCPPFYLENDDVSIRMALEGRTAPGQPPTGFVLGTHAVLGWAVVLMQRMLPSIPWWDVVLAATLLWATSVLLSLLWDALGSGWLARATSVGAVLVVLAPVVAGFQFTISATLAGGVAALLAVTELGPGRPRMSVLLMAFLLFAAGLLVRPTGSPAGAVAAAVLLLPFVRAKRWQVALVLLVAGIASASYLVAQQVERTLYATSREWDQYYRYNEIVRLIEWDTSLWQSHSRDIQESVGWSANDWSMLLASLGVDPVIHGFDRVNGAYETHTAIVDRVGAPWFLARVKDVPFEKVWDWVRDSALIVLAGGVLVGGFGSRRTVADTLALFGLFLALCFGVEVAFDRLPWRLLAPFQIICTAALIVTIGASRGAVSPLRGVMALSAVLAIVAPELSAAARQAADRRNRSEDVANREVAALRQLSPALVVHSGRFPREYWWRPFHPQRADLPALGLGWNNQNPQVQRFLTETGRQPLLRAVCASPSIIIVAEKSSLDLVTEYVKQHFDSSVEWTQVYDGTFPAWRCSSVGGIRPDSP